MLRIAMDQAYLGPHITHLASLTDQLEQYKDFKSIIKQSEASKALCNFFEGFLDRDFVVQIGMWTIVMELCTGWLVLDFSKQMVDLSGANNIHWILSYCMYWG